MRQRARALDIFFVLGLLGVVGASSVSAECAGIRHWEGEHYVDLRLGEGEQMAECRITLRPPTPWSHVREPSTDDRIFYDEVNLKIDGSGLMQVEIGFEGAAAEHFPATLGMYVERFDSSFRELTSWIQDVVMDPYPREVFVHTFADRNALRQLVRDLSDEQASERWEPLELVMTVRRFDEACWMGAWVSGDVVGGSGVATGRFFHGDVAYFTASKDGVKKGMMVGSMGDTELHGMLDSFGTPTQSAQDALDLAVQLGLLTPEEAAAADVGAPPESEPREEVETRSAFSDWIREELRPEDPTEGDTFGLNLASVDQDVRTKSLGGALAIFSGSFTLTLSGRVESTFFGPVEEGRWQEFRVFPSTITVTAALTDEGDRIPFEIPRGSGLLGRVTVDESREVINGWLSGELETKGVYTVEGIASSPRKLRIGVMTAFVARRGALGCMAP